LVESIYGRFSINNAHFEWIGTKCAIFREDLLSSIDASYQVSVHLAERFQRRRLKCEELMDDGCQVMAKAHIAFGKVS
jgi:hypothetical protein